MKMRIQGKVFQAMLTAWLMLVAIPNVVTAGPIEDGSAAYQRHDYETALRLLRGPAEQGSAEAQLLLGFMYHDGEGVPQDYAEAMASQSCGAGKHRCAGRAWGHVSRRVGRAKRFCASNALVAEGG
jgi:hypothetical protein